MGQNVDKPQFYFKSSLNKKNLSELARTGKSLFKLAGPENYIKGKKHQNKLEFYGKRIHIKISKYYS
jgi:hypothetical protein